MVRQARLVGIRVNIKGVDRVIARTNKIIGNIQLNSDSAVEKLMREAKTVAQNIIRSNTQGSGTLAESLTIRRQKQKEGNNKSIKKWTLTHNDAAKNMNGIPYSRYVNEGFTPHWVPAKYMQKWLDRHPNVKPTISKKGEPIVFVGGPNAASWTHNGLHYFETAYREVASKLRTELEQSIRKSIRGK